MILWLRPPSDWELAKKKRDAGADAGEVVSFLYSRGVGPALTSFMLSQLGFGDQAECRLMVVESDCWPGLNDATDEFFDVLGDSRED